MPTIKLKNIEIFYETHGQGKPLLLIAGYSCDHLFWEPVLSQLAKHYQVLVFDNRGVGQTKDSGEAFTLETMAEDTLALLNGLHIVRPFILGQSMGGAIAQIIARNYAANVCKLILLNSAAQFSTRTALALQSLLNLRKANVAFDDLVDCSLPWFYSSDYLAVPENIALLKEKLQQNPYPQTLIDQERQLSALKLFYSSDYLSEIKNVPTQIIAAAEDIIALPSESQQIEKIIPNSKMFMLPGGHSSPWEQSNRLCELLFNFFR